MSIQQSVSIATEVMKRGPAQHDMCGRFLSYPLTTIDESISAGLAERLVAHAQRALTEAGFEALVEGWRVTVSTMDGDERPAKRFYNVRWQNEKGGYIEVTGILTRHGWPTLNHGFDIGQE